MNTLVGVVCSVHLIVDFFPAPLGPVWQTATVDDIAGPTSRVDLHCRNDAWLILPFCDKQHRRQMRRAPYAERRLEGGRYDYRKQDSLERYFRDSRSGPVMESHVEALHDMIALSALRIAPWQEDA